MAERPEVVDHYGAHYQAFAADVYGEVRRAAFGEDIGQNSWLTVDELDRFLSRLDLRPGIRLLDVGCGSGGPTLHIARQMGCHVVGVELSEEAVAEATRLAHEAGLETRASFLQADASEPLPFEDGSFEALICIDVINHLPDRAGMLGDWARVLRSRGRLLFTDPVVITGVLDSEELTIRTSIGYFLFVPPGETERLLAAAGLTVVDVEDTTDHLAEIARRRHTARAAHADAFGRSRETPPSRVASDSSTLSRCSHTTADSHASPTPPRGRPKRIERPIPLARREGGPMAYIFYLELADGTSADPATFTTVAPQWRPGDKIPLGPGPALRVVGERVTDVDETPPQIIEDVSG